MKREKNLTCLTGAVFALLLSWGAVGSLITGFGLDVTEMGKLFGICVLSASVSALCFRFKWGGTVLLCLLVPVSWLLWRKEETVHQTLYMLHDILHRYDSAYGWGIPRIVMTHENPGSMLYPTAVIGALAAIAVSRTVCRRKGLSLAVMAAALPFALCFVVTDTVPDTKYIFLWMLGLVLLVLTNGVRCSNASQGITLCAMAAVPVAAALGLLFWAVPREGYDKHPEELQQQIVDWAQELPDLWEDVSDDVASGLSGAVQPSEVNLSTLGPRLRKVYPVMEVTAPESGTLYLRGQDYDLYDGTGWTANRHRTERFSPLGMGSSGNVTVHTRRVRDVLYIPYYPGDGVTLVGGQLDNSNDLKEYTFYQWTLPGDWRDVIRQAETQTDTGVIRLTLSYEAPQDSRRYLTLPDDTRRWAVDLLRSILSEEKTATAVADCVAAYVRKSARYDLDTQRMPSEHEDFARWFLEEGETGYCVHFATAATVLLRAAGVEARYVEGYMTTAVAGSAVTVTEDQAHAWVEYYEPILDTWIVLEATPGDLTEDTPQTAPAVQESEQPQPSTEAEERPTLPESKPETEPDPIIPGTEDFGEQSADLSGLWKWIRWIVRLALTAAAVLGQRKLRLRLRRRRQTQGKSNARALARWQEIELLYRLLKEKNPVQMEDLARKAKYSQHSITAEELKAMDKCIRLARQRLQEGRWYQKIVYQYIFAVY